ncbi:DUF3618 domain-containing protein [Plantactinospora sp. BB1]|uniref:DUF3618 domain-containing protein n=1 Tax=Plantactinospora sp. BB1 TaxID=2071627 RepID=UPI000D15E38A|nr:DUF3618 domain-containing protein [Plantactinospora sp. BB1]AVT38415.1 DUF3618 domain-containing protein [Plantactinospora sp. BB1]
MSTSTGKAGADPGTATVGGTGAPQSAGPEAIRADIARTRAELGDTVQHLAERADVKTRAKEKVAEVKDQAGQVRDLAAETAQVAVVRAGEVGRRAATRARQRPAPYVGVLFGLAAAVLTVVLLRRRGTIGHGARSRRWRAR